MVRSGHFHNQHRARNRRTHGGGEEGRHSNYYDISSVDSFNKAQANQNIGTDAACEGTDNQHGQEKAAGHATAVAYESKEIFANEEKQQHLQGYRSFGQVVNEIVTTAQYFG